MASTPKPPAAISIAGTPAAVKRRKAAGVNPATPTNGQLREDVRSEPGWGQVGATAPIDRRQDSVQQDKIGGSISRSPADPVLQRELQNQYLERFQAGTSDPIRPERPAKVKCLSSGVDQEPTLEKKGDVVLSRLHRRFKLKASGESCILDQQFSSQLERFLATLMLADHRLVGAAAGRRIQVADCTLADAGAGMMEGWTAEIYSRLYLMLSQEEPWETRLRELEMFASRNGRLPFCKSDSHYEGTLGRWLDSQCTAFRRQRLPLHRFQKLMSASSSLIRRRAEGWQTGDPDGRFREMPGAPSICGAAQEVTEKGVIRSHPHPGSWQNGWKM